MKTLVHKGSKKIGFTPAVFSPNLTFDKNIISQANMTTTMGSVLSPQNRDNRETSGLQISDTDGQGLIPKVGSKRSFTLSNKSTTKHRQTKTMDGRPNDL